MSRFPMATPVVGRGFRGKGPRTKKQRRALEAHAEAVRQAEIDERLARIEAAEEEKEEARLAAKYGEES